MTKIRNVFFLSIVSLFSSLPSFADETPIIEESEGWKYVRYDDDAPWKIRCFYYIPDHKTNNKTRIIQAGISMETIDELVSLRFKKHASPWNQKLEYRLEKCEQPKVCAPRSSSNPEQDNFSLTCQTKTLSEDKKEAIDRLRRKVLSYSSQILTSEKQHLSNAKSASTRAIQFQESWKKRAEPVLAEFAKFSRKFVEEYSPSYSTTSSAFAGWAKSAPSRGWKDLVVLKLDIDATLLQETFVASQYVYRAEDLSKNIERECNRMRSESDPYQEDFARAGLTVAPPSVFCTSVPISLERISLYANSRSKSINDAATKLQQNLSELISSKQTEEINNELRDSRNTSSQLTSSANFLAAVNSAVEGLRTEDSPEDVGVGVPLLTPRLQRLRLFQTYVIDCRSKPLPDWKSTGCLRVQSNEEPAKNLESKILHRAVSLGLQKLEQLKPSLFKGEGQEIRQMLTQGEISRAISAHDALVRGFGALQ